MGARVCRRGWGASSPPTPQYSLDVRWGGVGDGLDGRWRDVLTPPVSERAHVRRALPSKTVWSREGADVERRLGEDTWQVSARVMELLQVMSLLLKRTCRCLCSCC